jgi:hypothetical protein
MPANCQAGIFFLQSFVSASDKMYGKPRMAHFLTNARLCFLKQVLTL